MDEDGWGQYLTEIGRIPLLSRDEVTAAARRLEMGERARARLETPPMPDSKEAARLRAVVRDGARAKDLLVRSNLRLVVSVARRFRPVGMTLTLPDLVQEGAFGLIRAVEKFDHRRGFTFSTYATWWIRQAMSRAVAEQARSVRVPKHVSDEVAACIRSRATLAERRGHDPSVREVATVTGLEEERAGVLLRWAAPADSLQELAEDGYPMPSTADPIEGVLQRVELDRRRRLVEAALDRLPDKHRAVLSQRIGWPDGVCRSLRTVAATTGVSREKARRLEREAYEMLRGSALLAAARACDG